MEPSPVDCRSCGASQALPAGLAQGAEFACPACGTILRHDEHLAAFRWEAQDEFVRRHGASRGNLFGAVLGSSLWIPLFVATSLAQGVTDPRLYLAMIVPYGLFLVAAFKLRPRRPALLWVCEVVFLGLGTFLIWTWWLFERVPAWGRGIEGMGGWSARPAELVLPAAILIAVAIALSVWYRTRAKRLPQGQLVQPALAHGSRNDGGGA